MNWCVARFHVLSEFDEVKRSCRKRLAEHNRRRRKPATTASSKDAASPPANKKPNGGSITSSYCTDNKSKHICMLSFHACPVRLTINLVALT